MDFFKSGKMEYSDAARIINAALSAANPYDAVFTAIKGKSYAKKPYVVSIGKAAAVMAAAAYDALNGSVESGVVITKYHHTENAPASFKIFEAGHPLPDENSCIAAEYVLELTAKLNKDGIVIFLISGGGSALFEKPLISLKRLKDITDTLMSRGADINALNCVRKRFSAVKGGRFALHCSPARLEVFALSDVLGDRPDVIASGPAAPDLFTCAQARAIVEKYKLDLSTEEMSFIDKETPKKLDNVCMNIIGNIELLCAAAISEASSLGYEPVLLSASQQGEARVLGKALASTALRVKEEYKGRNTALIIGGETTVSVKGTGKGGRNQEIALSALRFIENRDGILIFSVGSDGTDGPTDAAGGIVCGEAYAILKNQSISIENELNNNNSYHALSACGGLIITGATGTNVNDLTVALIKAY